MAYSLKYTYNSSSQSYTVTGYKNITLSDIVVIPDRYDDGTHGSHPVTSIGNSAFKNCSNLSRVTIPYSVTSIGNSAFRGCSSLTNITIPKSVTRIDISTFRDCSNLSSVTIGNSLTSIGQDAFQGCISLTSMTIGNGVTTISGGAFYNCSKLKQLILLPSTPPTLGLSAIPNNVKLIYVPKSSKAAYQSATNWNAFASKIVSDNLYLSFARFNQKNKEYIKGKVDELSTKVAPILSDYVDDTLLGG